MDMARLSAGTPHRLGAHYDGDGVNFAVFSANATAMDLCLYSPDGQTETARFALPERSGDIWHVHVAGLQPGTLYGYRAHGPYAPQDGHRFNAHKLLMDPYTREVAGRWANDPALLGYIATARDEDLSFSTIDSAPFVPKSVVSDPGLLSSPRDSPPNSDRDLIYEAHPKGLTRLHPGIPDPLRGTYEGLASDTMLDHLTKLGVGSVELLPVHHFLDDKFLLDRGLKNYWGYNSIGFFAAEPRYFGSSGLQGFRQMVDRFHSAGIAVILDVVYNHTAEGDQRGPTIAFRGLDNDSYYRLQSDQPRYFVNDTGCGNTLNVAHPQVTRMVLDSLRFWVTEMGVDGFRFDLATTLAREDQGFDQNGGFLDALGQDPVLSRARLIAEPWDIGPGGYRLGGFPPPFAEWNDHYRDSLRQFWRGDAHSAQAMGARLLGSADIFDRAGRRADTSVNFIASHDGFTLADITRYGHRNNAANKEGNRDGHGANYSDNNGVEGDTTDPATQARRARRQRNMLAMLFLSQGTPMVLAGDEFGNSQLGNNNAYCQDNPIGWLNWDQADEGLMAFTAHLSTFRRSHPALRQNRFLHGSIRAEDHQPDVSWTDFTGAPLEWSDPALARFCLTLRGAAEASPYDATDDVVFAVFNRSNDAGAASLPPAPDGLSWARGIDTAWPHPIDPVPERRDTASIHSQSVSAFVLVPKGPDA
ncbi:glycogen debranching protein GlgX [Sulfitobacter sp. TSTF-M16]|uniref:Glycogen debranching protein GlgX n=1 Tax=Sulfitobacter aestuariivivens TaxID=2766981 RepID=A0A927HIB3_9RHOB|nr:glycogen debranching protein GlgX [Sulfitobacter aestuariivivens]MBD3666085.1 glycogen debranching protein GlgX [Sulfitobacter aestuariivivens]